MKTFIKTYWPFLAAVAFWVFAFWAAMHFFQAQNRKQMEELRWQLVHSQQQVPPERYVIRDTVEVIKHEAVPVERVKQVLSADDRALLKEVNVKLSAMESMQKTSLATQGTVTLSADTSLQIRDGFLTRDSVLRYRDEWCQFNYIPQSRSLEYMVFDSLTTIVARQYRHKFLWWRWGVKGYDIQIVNFNPHSTIRYDRYVRHK